MRLNSGQEAGPLTWGLKYWVLCARSWCWYRYHAWRKLFTIAVTDSVAKGQWHITHHIPQYNQYPHPPLVACYSCWALLHAAVIFVMSEATWYRIDDVTEEVVTSKQLCDIMHLFMLILSFILSRKCHIYRFFIQINKLFQVFVSTFSYFLNNIVQIACFSKQLDLLTY